MSQAHHCAPVSAGLAAGGGGTGLTREVAGAGEGYATAEVATCTRSAGRHGGADALGEQPGLLPCARLPPTLCASRAIRLGRAAHRKVGRRPGCGCGGLGTAGSAAADGSLGASLSGGG